MIKKNKIKLIISSIIILLPTILYFFSDMLSEQIAIHFGADGSPDVLMNAKLAFLIMPLILLAVHWICMVITFIVDKNNERNRKAMWFVFWIIPVISLMVSGHVFAVALGHEVGIQSVAFLILGVLFVCIGNYLPKTSRNITVGIKLKWTLSNDDNWNATHRFSGKVYVIIGILCLVSIFIPTSIAVIALPICAVIGLLLPVIYSYAYYKKQLKEGKATKEEYNTGLNDVVKNKKILGIATAVILVVVLIVVALLMFTGGIETTLGDTSLEVNAGIGGSVTLNYADIEAIEYRETAVPGQRVFGVGSAKILAGEFQNSEFGSYTRLTYSGDIPCIVLKTKDKIYVIGAEDATSTKQIYDSLITKTAK